MSKRKLKTKKLHFYRTYHKPLLAAAAFAVIAVPASWLMVSAQPTDEPSSQAVGQINHDTTTSAAGKVDGVSSAAPQAVQNKPSSTSQKPSTAKPTPAPALPTAKPSPAPISSPVQPAVQPGWHDNIITTIFWVGEAADPSNDYISNVASAWDGNWQANFGGFDDPNSRNGYYPAAFTPRENPFYFALPYNDLDNNGNRKPTAGNCPNAGASAVSWCKNAWIKIVKGGKIAYAQWQDTGPSEYDDVAYVFGTAAPKNTWGAKAGLDVSPAVRDYLGLADIDRVGWGFVSASSVPAGPWKNIVTTSPGGW